MTLLERLMEHNRRDIEMLRGQKDALKAGMRTYTNDGTREVETTDEWKAWVNEKLAELEDLVAEYDRKEA